MSQPQSQPGPPPPQTQDKPGIESQMEPRPKYQAPAYKGAGKLGGRVALITGGDSGIGRAVAVLYAREGADVAIVYLAVEESDAQETRRAVEAEGRRALLLPGDVTDPEWCRRAAERTVRELGRLDILVNNAAFQQQQNNFEDITLEQFDRTFKTNIYGYFYMVRAALPHLRPGSSVINVGSVAGHRGTGRLVDYAATKGAIHAFTKALAQNFTDRKVRWPSSGSRCTAAACRPGASRREHLPAAGVSPRCCSVRQGGVRFRARLLRLSRARRRDLPPACCRQWTGRHPPCSPRPPSQAGAAAAADAEVGGRQEDSQMFCNVGPVERLVRLLLAGAATVPVLAGRQSPRFRRRAAIAAAAELFTAATRFCPANALLGINNCRRGAPGRVAAWAALGAGLAYLFDPHAGAGRRAKLRDRLAAVSGRAGAARPAGLAGGRAPTAPVESELHGV